MLVVFFCLRINIFTDRRFLLSFVLPNFWFLRRKLILSIKKSEKNYPLGL